MKNKFTTTAIVKIVLAVALFLCLAKMPYGYYQLVRAVCMIGFGILALHAHQSGNSTESIIYIGLILLFQPFSKLALGRDLWNLVDVAIGAWLAYSVFKEQQSSKA